MKASLKKFETDCIAVLALHIDMHCANSKRGTKEVVYVDLESMMYYIALKSNRTLNVLQDYNIFAV